MPSAEVDEILEIVWLEREAGVNDLCVIKDRIRSEKLQDLCAEMADKGLLKISGGKIVFSEEGERLASALIRRHRLAERLLTDVMDAGKDGIEEPACQFEHLVSEEVTDAICTLLGHPRFCPHNLPIPQGKCCAGEKEMVDRLIFSLDKMEIGEWATVAYILAQQDSRLHKLMAFGIVPGVKIKVHQKSPAYVIQVEETQIALEKEVVQDIFIRRG